MPDAAPPGVAVAAAEMAVAAEAVVRVGEMLEAATVARVVGIDVMIEADGEARTDARNAMTVADPRAAATSSRPSGARESTNR